MGRTTMRKFTLFLAVLLISTGALADNSNAKSAAGLWWGALDSMSGVLMFSTDKGAYDTLVRLLNESKPGQNISKHGLRALVKGNNEFAFVDLVSLKEAILPLSGKTKTEEDKMMAPMIKHHKNTQFVCNKLQKNVFCFLKK